MSARIALDVVASFNANVPPNPQHDSGARQRDEVEPLDVPQQPHGAISDAQQPQRVTRRVVRDPAREPGADVLDAEHIDQQLRQLVSAAGQRPGIGGQRRVAHVTWRHLRALFVAVRS